MQQQPDTRPGFYYVSVVRGKGDYRLLRGPFENDHAAALAEVDRARTLCEAMDPKAVWYAYGTCWLDKNHGPGILDKLEGAPS